MFEMVLLRNAKVKKRCIMFKMVLLKNAEVTCFIIIRASQHHKMAVCTKVLTIKKYSLPPLQIQGKFLKRKVDAR